MPHSFQIDLKTILKGAISWPMRLRFPPMPRPALKTLTYSLMHFAVAISVAFALTGSWKAALAIGLIEPLVQTGAYALHESAWAKAGRNRDRGPDQQILSPAT